MTLTYAIVEDFIEMKDLKKSGIVVNMTELGRTKIEQYLVRATRFIQRNTRRDFFPWRETRRYPVPHAFYDLSVRRFPSAHLNLDQDLLEVFELNNGQQIVPEEYFYPLEHNIKPHSALAIKFPMYWGGLFGGSVPYSRYDEAVIQVDALWGYAENTGGWRYPEDFWIDADYGLESAMSDSSVALSVTDLENRVDLLGEKPFLSGRLLKIDDEYIEVMAANTTTNTVSIRRGVRGSTAAEHDEGAPIYRWRVIEDIVEACLQIAKTWREADLAVGGRIGVSDVSPGAEISIPSDPMMTLKSYQRSMILE